MPFPAVKEIISHHPRALKGKPLLELKDEEPRNKQTIELQPSSKGGKKSPLFHAAIKRERIRSFFRDEQRKVRHSEVLRYDSA